jgi:hypothetical protein
MYSASVLIMDRRHPTPKCSSSRSRSKDSDVFQVMEISGLAKHPMGSEE